jgi:hypothetical protein
MEEKVEEKKTVPSLDFPEFLFLPRTNMGASFCTLSGSYYSKKNFP